MLYFGTIFLAQRARNSLAAPLRFLLSPVFARARNSDEFYALEECPMQRPQPNLSENKCLDGTQTPLARLTSFFATKSDAACGAQWGS